MKHIKVIDYGKGFLKLIPTKGYMLKFGIVDQLYSEAVVKPTKGWTAVKV